MALRRRLYVPLLLLLLAVAFLASPAVGLPPGGCYETATKVSRRCSGEFIKALFSDDLHGVSRKCCDELTCVREQSCFSVLLWYCPPEAWAHCYGGKAAAWVPLQGSP
ncbi:hypothetical protein CFC21_024239 [Triticum aestivum]|uniref:Prolamin-like domain-containing protein n=2 Tax=Triticum aestivum TaxID=4565 RepID=A0A3B6C8V3_WHEAT|nr:hypothetical protein CFC21_024239 [Triticum aestivum]